jgi:hypothetical protein
MKKISQLIQPGSLFLTACAGVLLALSPLPSNAQDNTFYGVGALQSGTKTGLDDSAFGFDALNHTTTGAYNTAVGFDALDLNKSGNFNTATGAQALYGNTGSNNTADGTAAL